MSILLTVPMIFCMNKRNIFLSLAITGLLSSCATSQLDRLEWLGKAPPMNPVQPKNQEEPIKWPVSSTQTFAPASSNSLWDGSSKTFFKDQRAAKVGDILTVRVTIQDKAQLGNKTESKRTENDNVKIPEAFGLQGKIAKLIPGIDGNPANLLDQDTTMNNKGEGIINRSENIVTQVAAVITDVLPNGNFVIYGSQEVRVNFEVRQLTVRGVIRPEDITPNNEIAYSQIAEARISYGGKGIITDIQQPRIGNQLADILSPW